MEDEALDDDQDVPLGLQARLEDLVGLDIEGPIQSLTTVQDYKIAAAYREAARLHEKLGDDAALQSARVFAMMADVMGMHFKPYERHAPFGPNMVADGRRTAIPEDFRGEPVSVLAAMSGVAQNPAVKARLADVCWLLERSRRELGLLAVQSYVGVCHILPNWSDEPERRPPHIVGPTARDAVYRALTIARRIGWDTVPAISAKAFVADAQVIALQLPFPATVRQFFELDLDFSMSDPADVAAQLESYLASDHATKAGHQRVELWRLAARAHHASKNDESKNRCLVQAAECLAAEAESHPDSAMLASHWLSLAVAAFHGIPGQRQRRKELQHKLVDRQADILDEMATFSQDVEIGDIVKATREHFGQLNSLKDMLLAFALIERPPTQAKLVQDAVEVNRSAPLSQFFNTTIHDRQGKTVFVSEGGEFDQKNQANAYVPVIARHEGMRRQLVAVGNIEIARQLILERYYLGEDTFGYLLRYSAFVPEELIGTCSRGFQRFFEGDFISALYILTPMLEATLRHVLRLAGHDVTKFDDAKTTQEDLTISRLFEEKQTELTDIFGPETIGDLERVFLKQPGPTIRHDVAHGSLTDGTPFGADAMYACWSVYRLCCLPILKKRAEIILPADLGYQR
jgi:hypothetical protein